MAMIRGRGVNLSAAAAKGGARGRGPLGRAGAGPRSGPHREKGERGRQAAGGERNGPSPRQGGGEEILFNFLNSYFAQIF